MTPVLGGPVPDGEYIAVVEELSASVQAPTGVVARGRARRAVQSGEPGEQPAPTAPMRRLTWRLLVELPSERRGTLIRKSAPFTTAEHLLWALRDLSTAGLRNALRQMSAQDRAALLVASVEQLNDWLRAAEGARVRVRVETSGQWRRVYVLPLTAVRGRPVQHKPSAAAASRLTGGDTR